MVPADLLPLAFEPERLVAMIDPARGLTLVRELDCERQDTVDDTRHLCRREVTSALEPVFVAVQERIRNAISHPDRSTITCRAVSGRRTECTLPPANECASIVVLVFAERTLIALVERDDWQALPEARRVLDRRVAVVTSGERRCP
jgi:hypothetical protein